MLVEKIRIIVSPVTQVKRLSLPEEVSHVSSVTEENGDAELSKNREDIKMIENTRTNQGLILLTCSELLVRLGSIGQSIALGVVVPYREDG